MKKFGLIGYPLSHSFSKSFFDKKFDRENILDAEYKNYPLEKIEDFPALIENIKDLKGLNVTTPYKESIIPYLTELDDTAKEIGAVNCIKIERNERLILKGYNTDVYGFKQSIKPFLDTTGVASAL